MPRRKGEPCAGCGYLRCQCLELELAFHLRAIGLEDFAREAPLVPGRKWRADFAWPAELLAIEVEGGTWAGGRHSRGDGFRRDCEKYNAATLAGWRVLRFDAGMVKDGTAAATIAAALGRGA